MAARLAKLEKAYRQHPGLPLFARLAEQYLQQGMVLRAMELCQKGCEQFPDYPPGFLVLGRCYEAREDWEAARGATARALRLDPENPAGLKRLSTIYERLGEFDLARKSLAQAGRLDPLDEQTLHRLDQFEYHERLAEVRPDAEPYDELPREPDIRTAERRQRFSNERAPASAAAVVQPDSEGPGPAAERPQSTVSRPAEPPDAGASGVVPEPEHVVREQYSAGAVAKDQAAPPAGEAGADSQQPGGQAPEEPAQTAPEQLDRLAPPDNDDLVRVFLEIEETIRPEAGPQSADGDASPSEAQPEPAAPADVEQESASPELQIVTVTLAEIYNLQGLTAHAMDVYRRLLAKEPGNQKYKNKLAELQQLSSARDTAKQEEKSRADG